MDENSEQSAIQIPKEIRDLAKAIAYAEGFGKLGTVPTRAHNPGDIKVPSWTGEKTGEEGITVFPDDETGWHYLYDELFLIKNGQSHVYNIEMTLEEFANKWTDTQSGDWLANVLARLAGFGYHLDWATTLGEFFKV